MQTASIGVALVDDQTLIRQGLRSLLDLTADIRVVCEAEDGAEAIRVLPDSGASVVLLDVRMPRRSGIEVLRELRRAGREIPTILLTTFDDDAALLEGIRAGARGFLLKTVSFEQLVQAIRTVADGRTLFLPGITERVLRELQASGEAPVAGRARPDPLTQREAEILRLVAGGYSNREIGGALGSAEGTVKNHVSSILLKLEARDRTSAVLKALELGIL